MEVKDIQQGSSESGEGEAVNYVHEVQKVDVEIREVVRIRPQDFSALKNSFEEWAKQWD